jgi:hypothetical protein
MWYDMRHGHKTVLGDAGFVPSLARFTVGRILPSDIRDLLTNRGTLLVINDLLLERGAPALDERKLIVRHGMKAVIGYGDALLFFLGDYHWSYAEKARRMARRTDVEPDFCDAYRRAIEFRFRPSYAAYVDRDLGDWVATMKRALAAVHLAVEARRLRRALPGWDVYQDAALRHAIVEDLPAWRAAAKKACYAVAGGSGAPGLSLAARLGLRMAGPRGVLPILFPAVAYPEADGRSRDRARAILRAPSSHAASLRRAYLRAWSVDGDVNFSGQLARYAIDLRDPPA